MIPILRNYGALMLKNPLLFRHIGRHIRVLFFESYKSLVQVAIHFQGPPPDVRKGRIRCSSRLQLFETVKIPVVLTRPIEGLRFQIKIFFLLLAHVSIRTCIVWQLIISATELPWIVHLTLLKQVFLDRLDIRVLAQQFHAGYVIFDLLEGLFLTKNHAKETLPFRASGDLR